jgi:hypothetical protein
VRAGPAREARWLWMRCGLRARQRGLSVVRGLSVWRSKPLPEWFPKPFKPLTRRFARLSRKLPRLSRVRFVPKNRGETRGAAMRTLLDFAESVVARCV